MTAHRKGDVVIRAREGMALNPRSLVRVSKSGTILTYRHRWPEKNTDGNVWNGVRTCVVSFAQKIADAQQATVEIYSQEGSVCGVIEPRR